MRAALVAVALVALSTPAVAAAEPAGCARLHVPMAERQVVSCLDELTTAGTVASGHTVQADWAGLTQA
ncbi:MAG: tannase/feruloyl esterase family alpha/beta hydrolase, partial [Actinomycetota bacterium]|nr:tannase/feruloyl esterase family alpha/beta hydrolase [Actinomycetota bacterium]